MNRVKSEGKLNAGASLSAEPLDASQGTLHAATTAAAEPPTVNIEDETLSSWLTAEAQCLTRRWEDLDSSTCMDRGSLSAQD